LAGLLWGHRQDIGPSGRSGHAMTYDPVHKRTLLAGGLATAPTSFETWAWSGKYWTQTGRFGPSGRSGTALSYDEDRQRVILFGGSRTTDSAETSDTWSPRRKSIASTSCRFRTLPQRGRARSDGGVDRAQA